MQAATFLHDGSGRLRTVWRLTICLLAFLVVQFAIGVAAYVGLIGFGVLTGRADGLDPALEWLGDADVVLQMIATPFLAAGALALIWLCRRFLDRRRFSSLGLAASGGRWCASVGVGLLAGPFPIAAVVGCLGAAGLFGHVGAARHGMAWAMMPVLALAAFEEELLCRGYLLQNMLDVGRPVWGVLVSSTIFWLLHAVNPNVWDSPFISANLFLSGVLFALAYMLSDDLWFPTAMHFAWNAAQGPVFGVPISGVATPGMLTMAPVEGANGLLTGGQFGLEGSVLVTALLAAGCVILLVLVRRRPRVWRMRELPEEGVA